MVNYVGHEKPGLEDTIEHYGVLGMKWGKTRARANGTQIRAARRRVSNQINGLGDQRDKVKAAKGTSKETSEKNKLNKMKTDFLKNPDRVVAARLTRGEKAAILILAGPAAPFSIGAIAGSSAASRRIEQKQAQGAYNKKK